MEKLKEQVFKKKELNIGRILTIKDIFLNRILLFGYGKMGGALLDGWLEKGLDLKNVFVFDPNPSHRLLELEKAGANLNPDFISDVGVCIIAVKPQIIDNLLASFPKNITFPLLISVVAGIPIVRFKKFFGDQISIFRVMPNTPSLISEGVTAIFGEESAPKSYTRTTELLMSAVGDTVQLQREFEIDIATAISGSGPAYAFLLIEAMVDAGIELGLSKEISLKLAKNTISGAGSLSLSSNYSPEVLRNNVTSPGGTTEAALKVLLANGSFKKLMISAIRAAHKRSLELKK